MNENIVFLNIINREGQLILKNEQYIKETIYLKKKLFELFFIRQFFFNKIKNTF